GAGWPHRRSVDAGRRAPSTSNLRAHRGRPPGARPPSGVVAGVRDRGVGRSPAGGDMPGDRMTRTAELDPAAVRVVEDYLAELAERMPAHAPLTPDMVAALRDHLVDTTVPLIPDSPSPVAAARGAVADFGDVETVAGAMQPELAERKARRIGIALFATGPLVGGCWLAAVFLSMSAASAWRWLPILVAPVLLIGAPASVLTVASSGRMSRRLSPCTALAGRAVTVAGAA